MRIPDEALPPIMNGITGEAKNSPAGQQRPAPVDQSSDLRPQMDHPSLAERRAAANEEALRRAILAANQRNEERRKQGERRKTERRQRKQTVFLDTRQTRSRRADASRPAIDVEA